MLLQTCLMPNDCAILLTAAPWVETSDRSAYSAPPGSNPLLHNSLPTASAKADLPYIQENDFRFRMSQGICPTLCLDTQVCLLIVSYVQRMMCVANCSIALQLECAENCSQTIMLSHNHGVKQSCCHCVASNFFWGPCQFDSIQKLKIKTWFCDLLLWLGSGTSHALGT